MFLVILTASADITDENSYLCPFNLNAFNFVIMHLIMAS